MPMPPQIKAPISPPRTSPLPPLASNGLCPHCTEIYPPFLSKINMLGPLRIKYTPNSSANFFPAFKGSFSIIFLSIPLRRSISLKWGVIMISVLSEISFKSPVSSDKIFNASASKIKGTFISAPKRNLRKNSLVSPFKPMPGPMTTADFPFNKSFDIEGALFSIKKPLPPSKTG